MKETGDHRECPPFASLVEWFDGKLDEDEAARVEEHADRCGPCRQALLDWSERVDARTTATPVGCPDAETLAAYGNAPAALAPTSSLSVERHLLQCARCVTALQHLMTLQRQMHQHEPAASSDEAAARAPEQRDALPQAHPLADWAAAWWRWRAALLTPGMWPRAVLATAAAVVLAVGVVRFMSPVAQYQEMRVRDAKRAATVEVVADAAARARPAMDEPIVLQLSRGMQVRWLERSGEWTRIELADGRRVWVESGALKERHGE